MSIKMIVGKLERLANFNLFVCSFISMCFRCFIFKKETRDLLKKSNRFDVIISNNHLSYFLNIAPVIKMLSETYRVAICVEKDDAQSVILELIRRFPSCEVIDVNYRLLPFFYSRVHLSSIAGKDRYFSKSLERVFYFHGTANLAGFKTNGMKAYDLILCATHTQYLEVSSVYAEKSSRLVGYPKLSPVKKNQTRLLPKTSMTLLYCPSYRGVLNSTQIIQLFEHEGVLKSLLKNRVVKKLIIRPHPQDVVNGNLNSMLSQFNDDSKVIFDFSQDYDLTYAESDALVTDFSGTAVSYTLMYGKPAICVLKSLELIEEMQPYALEVCKVILNLNDLASPDFLRQESTSLQKNILELRKLHSNAVENFVLSIEECLIDED
jgi:hypothetical protein